MDLSKAIEIIQHELDEDIYHHNKDRYDALRLAKEALKRCNYNYLDPQHADFRLLPGETKEK